MEARTKPPAAATAFVVSIPATRFHSSACSATPTRALLPLPRALTPRRPRFTRFARPARRPLKAKSPPQSAATPSSHNLTPRSDASDPSSSQPGASSPDCVPDFAPMRVARSRNSRRVGGLLGFSVPSLVALAGFAAFVCATHPTFASWRVALLALPATMSSLLATLGTTRAALLLFALNFTTVLLCFPANMGLMIAAGALLPSLPAFLALYLSKLCAAVASYALARGLLAKRAEGWLARRRRLAAALRAAAGGAGWRLVFVLRLSPFPGFLLNYLLPLAGVPFAAYLAGTACGVAPSVLNLVLIGSAARSAGHAVAGQQQGAAAWLGAGVRVACVLSMIGVMFAVTRAVRAALDGADGDVDGLTSSLADGLDVEEEEEDEDEEAVDVEVAKVADGAQTDATRSGTDGR